MDLPGLGVDHGGGIASVSAAVLLVIPALLEDSAGHAEIVSYTFEVGVASYPAVVGSFGQTMFSEAGEVALSRAPMHAEDRGQRGCRQRVIAEHGEGTRGREPQPSAPSPCIRRCDANAPLMSYLLV